MIFLAIVLSGVAIQRFLVLSVASAGLLLCFQWRRRCCVAVLLVCVGSQEVPGLATVLPIIAFVAAVSFMYVVARCRCVYVLRVAGDFVEGCSCRVTRVSVASVTRLCCDVALTRGGTRTRVVSAHLHVGVVCPNARPDIVFTMHSSSCVQGVGAS